MIDEIRHALERKPVQPGPCKAYGVIAWSPRLPPARAEEEACRAEVEALRATTPAAAWMDDGQAFIRQ